MGGYEMLKINAQRLERRLGELADLARTETGINRLVYSDAFWRSCDYVERAMEEAGLTVRRGKLGNVVGTCPGETERRLVMGSHIDSVPDGGMFDGCLGVMAAIEVMQTLREEGVRLRHTVDACAWSGEEGVAVSGMPGSWAYCGAALSAPQMEQLAKYGVGPADVAECRAGGPVDAALELHIEQGGVLESEGMDIGVVRAIAGLERYSLEFSGQANHAGTTPMALREDALVKAARFIVRCREAAAETDPEMVITVGRVEVSPNAVNVVPGHVRLTLELRGEREASIERAFQTLTGEFREEIVSCVRVQKDEVCPMDREVMAAVSAAGRELGLRTREMVSGAAHDTMALAKIARPGMIFVPSIGGISHNPLERTEWRDAANGAGVLLHTLLRLDRQYGAGGGRDANVLSPNCRP